MKIPFNPIQGTEEIIQQQSITQGNLYFAIDTGKILLDKANERITLGGSGAAVFYSSIDNLQSNTDDTYSLPLTALDDQFADPEKDDLIINSDGRFFKVNYINKETQIINCKLIAVSGSGGDGPSGPDNPEDPKFINVSYHNLTYSFLAGSNYTIDLTASSSVDLYLNISYTVRNAQGYTTGFGSLQSQSGSLISLPVGQYISSDGGFHGVDITIQGANSYRYTNTINRIQCIDLKVEQDIEKFTSQKIYNETVPYYVKVYGKIEKTLCIEVDNELFTTKMLSKNDDNNSIYIPIECKDKLEPGVHNISAYLTTNGIQSNKISTDFIYHPQGTADTTYIIITDYPTKCMSYETPTVFYWIYNTAQAEGYKNSLSFIVNGAEVLNDIEEPQKIGESLKWNVTSLEPNIKNTCAIKCGGISSKVFEIYCEYSDIFEPTSDGAILMLDADGRTNNTSLERRLDWKYTNDRGITYTALLKDFNWNNNGWKSDEGAGRNCLRVSNGASIEIPMTIFSNAAPNIGGFTFEFEFKPYNLYSYNLLTQSTTTIENDTEEDDEVEILREFNSDLAVISYIATGNDDKAYGICCGTQDAFFRMSDGKNVTVRYTNDTIVSVAITVNAAKEQICMYVNGVMSGMVAYDRSSAKLPIQADKLIINSEQCDLDIYNIRIYDQALTSKQIVQNYISNTKDINIYNQNIFNAADETVSLAALQDYNDDNPSNATIPYMIFKTKSPDILPFNKANEDVVCSIEFVNPALDYALAKGEIDEVYYKKHAPSFTADEVTINVQGTSSQKYPRKNFKGKFKKAKNWQCRARSVNDLVENKSLSKFYMDENIAEKTICWKADYMDSSSCHNTGFASFAQELYWNHPLDYYEGTNVAPANKEGQLGEYRQKYRTSLYGFPVLVFHQKSDGSTEFIGRYNFNLDKGADDTLGMALDKQHKVLTNTTYEKICECWEMANNMGGRCSFRGNPFDYCYDYTHINADGTTGAYIVDGKESQSDIGDDIEVRYHINGDAIEGAWDNLTKPLDDGGTPISSREAFEVLLGGDAEGNNRTGAYAHLEKLFKWLKSCYYAFDMNTAEDREWVTELLGHAPLTDENGNYYDADGVPIDLEFKELRNARKVKFENEFDKHLNKEYCMVYYILTELLLQYDSRGKNMMISSWGPMEEGGDYIWFPIFYDIDTQLGVNNSGIPSWEYNVEPTTGFNNPGGNKAFSTANSLLWNNFHQSYAVDRTDVRDYYRLLRGSTLTIAKINGYYNFDYNISKAYCMKGILPISIMNANQNYKYIAPSTKGYIIGIDETGAPKYRTTSAYFYCLQGTRELHRAQLLRNRFNYYDSKWMAQDYQPGTGGSAMRWRANAYDDPEDSSLHSHLTLHVKPALDQYLVLWPDESATYVVPIFAKGGETAVIDLSTLFSSGTYQQQLIYIGGYKYLQEFGDVSLLYLDEFEFPDDANNITKIQLGNENPRYRPNEQFKVDAIDEATQKKPLLTVFDITNINKINSKIQLLDSVKLETFKALGSQITGAIFADGVNLQQLYLPNTVNSLTLNKAANLTKILYNSNELKETLEDGTIVDAKGLYIEDLVKDDNGSKTTNISEINIVGGELKLYSYDMLNKITEAVNNMIQSDSNATLSINMEDVHWTPYRQLGEGAIYETSKASKYKYATNNYSYRDYSYIDENQWQLDLLNGRIYEYTESPIASPTNLDLLNVYLNQDMVEYNDTEIPKNFTNITDTIVKALPIITGDLYIDNASQDAISEADIANIYGLAFPNLSIKAAKIIDAYRARFVTLDGNIEREIQTYRFNKSDENKTIIPPSNDKISVPEHYDFAGWSLQPNGTIITNFSQFMFTEENNEYIFYAVFKKHKYKIEYINLDANSKDDYYKTYDIEFESQMIEPAEIPLRSYEEGQLENVTERIAFKGWTLNEQYAGIQSDLVASQNIINPLDYPINKNYKFYAVFVQESVYKTITDNKYFTFTYDSQNDGYKIKLNNSYILSGKITLPLYYDNKPIVSIDASGFIQSKHNITHIFWDNTKIPVIKEILTKAFWRDNNNLQPTLEYFEFPNSITTIGASAFGEQALTNIVLPIELIEIGEEAFIGCSKLNLSQIGGKVETIGSFAFGSAIGEETLIIGDSVKTIGPHAFAYYRTPLTGGKGLKKVVIGRGIISIAVNAFVAGNDSAEYNTITSIELNVPENSVSNSPWGATRASIIWKG